MKATVAAERAGAPRMPFALLVTGLVAGGLAALLGLNTMSAANELHRHQIATKDAAVAAQLQQLSIEVAQSAAPDNLARAATALGMVPAGNPAFLVIGPDGKVRVMGEPAPATAPPVPAPPKPKPKPAKTDTKKTDTKKTKSKKTDTTKTKTDKKRTTKTDSTTHTPTTTTVTLPGGTR